MEAFDSDQVRPVRPATADAARTGGVKSASAEPVLGLQTTAGNKGVAQLLAAQRAGQIEGDELDNALGVGDVVGHGRGEPLDADTRTDMEASLGHDFSDVRVHTGSDANDSAKAIKANAYTVGNEVVFADGHYSPGSSDARRTLAHELTHVVQQRSGPVDGTPTAAGISVSDPSDRFERAAEDTSARVAQGATHAAGPSGLGDGSITAAQRESAPDEEPEDVAQGEFVQRETADEEPEEVAQGSFVQRDEDPDEGLDES